MISAINIMNTKSEQKLFVCTKKYESNRNLTLANERIMSASPINLGPLNQFIPVLTVIDDDDHNQIITTMIQSGEGKIKSYLFFIHKNSKLIQNNVAIPNFISDSFYWNQYEKKLNCSEGIRLHTTVTITDSGDLYGNDEQITLIDGSYCLSPSKESPNYMNAYECEGFSGELRPEDIQKIHDTQDGSSNENTDKKIKRCGTWSAISKKYSNSDIDCTIYNGISLNKHSLIFIKLVCYDQFKYFHFYRLWVAGLFISNKFEAYFPLWKFMIVFILLYLLHR